MITDHIAFPAEDRETIKALRVCFDQQLPFHWRGADYFVTELVRNQIKPYYHAKLEPFCKRPAIPPAAPPPAPARHCSCGKPATRGGLCSAEPAATVGDTNARRQAFELWVIGRKVVKRYGAKLTQRPDGSYADYRINDRWVAWNAALDTMGKVK